MSGHIWKPTLALGAVLAVSGAVGAGDRDTMLLGGGSGAGPTTMTLGGKGSVAEAVTEDIELAGHGGWGGGHWGGGHWGGGGWNRVGWGGGWNRGWGWGSGWNRGWGWNNWNRVGWGGWGWNRWGWNNWNRVGWGWGWNRGWGWGWGGWPVGWGGWGWGWNRGWGSPVIVTSVPAFSPSVVCYDSWIGLGGAGTGAATVPLGGGYGQPMAQPVAPGDGTFPYDGGPSNPVPRPMPDARPLPPSAPPAIATDLSISLKPKPAATPYKYKAYGEK